MDFNEYQKEQVKLAIYPDLGNNITYPVLGLCGESGEVAEKIKKMIRDDGGIMSDEKKNDLSKELGDVLWYISAVAFESDLSLEDIAKQNIAKLKDRALRGVRSGSGDNR